MKTDDELRADGPQSEDRPRLAHERMMEAGSKPAPDKRISLMLMLSLIVLLGISGGWQLLLVVFALIVMIVLHELGHYLTAKRSGMKVTEFFLGFGPKLWSVQRGETEYGVKAIPAGAYVRIIGMNNIDEVPPEDEPRTYRQQSYPKRVAVASAGSAMHFLQAIIAVFLVFTVFGAPGGHLFTQPPAPPAPVIGEITPGSAAAAADLHSGDMIRAIDGETVTDFDQLHDALVTRAGTAVTLDVERDGQRFERDHDARQRYDKGRPRRAPTTDRDEAARPDSRGRSDVHRRRICVQGDGVLPRVVLLAVRSVEFR